MKITQNPAIYGLTIVIGVSKHNTQNTQHIT